MSNDQPDSQTVGDVLAPGVTHQELTEATQTLQRFQAVAEDEYPETPAWIRVLSILAKRTAENYDTGIQTND